MILKDLASARDEATPPVFRELVERYYEVISKGVRTEVNEELGPHSIRRVGESNSTP